jgi:hypothetical protein
MDDAAPLLRLEVLGELENAFHFLPRQAFEIEQISLRHDPRRA